MNEHLHHDRTSLDSQAFAAVLAATFICTLLWVIGAVRGEMPAQPMAIAFAPSQLQCTRL